MLSHLYKTSERRSLLHFFIVYTILLALVSPWREDRSPSPYVKVFVLIRFDLSGGILGSFPERKESQHVKVLQPNVSSLGA